MPAKWVNMKEVKQHVSMEDVLAHYKLLDTLQKKGNSLVGPCPIHKGTNSNQFSVSLAKNVFNCFGNCHGGHFLQRQDVLQATLVDHGVAQRQFGGSRVAENVTHAAAGEHFQHRVDSGGASHGKAKRCGGTKKPTGLGPWVQW